MPQQPEKKPNSLRQRVLAEQVELAYKLAPLALTGNVIIASLTYLLYGSEGLLIHYWGLAMILLHVGRGVAAWRYLHRDAAPAPEDRTRSLRRDMLILVIPYFGTALMWSALPLLLASYGQAAASVVAVAVVYAIAGASLSFVGHLRTTYIAYLCCVLVPLALTWIFGLMPVDPYLGLPVGFATLLFIGVLAAASGRYSQMMEEAIQTRLEREASNTLLRREVERRARAEAEANIARDIARRAEAAQKRFLANVSHELRTPLHAIIGYSELLVGEADAAAAKSHAERIIIASNGLSVLVNDLLDLSRIDAEKLDLEVHSFDPRTLLQEAMNTVELPARAKRLALSCEFDRDLPEALATDAGRLRQIVLNLLGNAVKFTPAGAVVLRATVERPGPPADPAQVTLVIEVADTGIGISPDAQQRIFDVFAQAERASARNYSGSGLGLAISRRLARVMGGDLSVQSMEGIGSTFTARVACQAGGAQSAALAATAPGPGAGTASAGIVAGQRGRADAARLAVPPSRPNDEPPPADATLPPRAVFPLSGARILVADDDELSRRLAGAILSGAGAAVDLAADGAQALEFAVKEQYDLILLDLEMPVRDGYATCHAIRVGAGPNRLVPVVALTARAAAEIRERALDAGMNEVLSKPLRRSELVAAVVRVMREGLRIG